MKKIIIVVFILLAINLFADKYYVADGTATLTYYEGLLTSYTTVGDLHYIANGDFSTIVDDSDTGYRAHKTTFLTSTYIRGIVIAKSNTEIEFWSTSAIDTTGTDFFYFKVSNGHATMCYNKFIGVTTGYVNPDSVYVGTIRLQTNLLPLAVAFNIKLVSVSQNGMTDAYAEYYGTDYAAEGIQIVHAYGDETTALANSWNPDHINPWWTQMYNGIISVSYSTTASVNGGSHGNGLEFLYPETSQSAATPSVAGTMAVIANHSYYGIVDTSWESIRSALIETASQGGYWTPEQGYGIINRDDAIDWIQGTYTPEYTSPPGSKDFPTYKDNSGFIDF